MSSDTFIHRGDLVNEINRLGAFYDIKEVSIDTPNIFMLTCTNSNENCEIELRCEAKIIGMYSQKDKQYHIKKIKSLHSCFKNTKREEALQEEIQKINPKRRIGEIVELLYNRYKVGYLEVFKAILKLNQSQEEQKDGRFDFFENENIKNNNNNNSESLFIKEDQNFEFDGCRDSIISQKTDDSKLNCLHSLKDEFLKLNPKITCEFTRNNFYFKHKQMLVLFRKVREIKIIQRNNGTVILGLLFDSNDDFIINSVLISEESKIKALEVFLEFETQNNDNTPLLYLVDLDFEVIDFLISKNHPFFTKSRAIFHYLHDSKDDDINSLNYFNEINYGERDFLDLDKKYYLRKFCPVNLFNLNTAHYPDFEYITPHVLSLPFVDLITSLIWLISDDIKSRKLLTGEDFESRFCDTLVGVFEDFEDKEPSLDYEVNLEKCYCGCGKFQEFLFPCIHAYKLLKKLGKDPLLYTSNLYNKELISKVEDIVPVVNIKVHPSKPRIVGKRKKGEIDSSCENNK